LSAAVTKRYLEMVVGGWQIQQHFQL